MQRKIRSPLGQDANPKDEADARSVIGPEGRERLRRVLDRIDAEIPDASGFAAGYLESLSEDISRLVAAAA